LSPLNHPTLAAHCTSDWKHHKYHIRR